MGIELGSTQIVDVADSRTAAARGVELARNGAAQMLMKGSLHTDEIMGAVVSREGGMRTGRRISHVFALDVPAYHKTLFVTDAAINIQPDLETKVSILQNAIDMMRTLEVEMPKVAILSAVESVNPAIPSTLDAAALCKMVDRGQITGAIVDGPLAFDNAISSDAARIKKIKSPVSGDVDLLMVPNLEAGNILFKQLQYLAGALAAGVVVGAESSHRAHQPGGRRAGAHGELRAGGVFWQSLRLLPCCSGRLLMLRKISINLGERGRRACTLRPRCRLRRAEMISI